MPSFNKLPGTVPPNLHLKNRQRRHNTLISGVSQGDINRGEFLHLTQFSRESERQRARMAEGGFTPQEGMVLAIRDASYSNLERRYLEEDVQPEVSPELDRIDESLLRSFDAVNQAQGDPGRQSRAQGMLAYGLEMTANHAYSTGAENRNGPIFSYERAMLRSGRYFQRALDGVRDGQAEPAPQLSDEARVEAQAEGQLILGALERNFEQLDQNGDGQLDRLEMGALLRDAESYGLEPEQAASVYTYQDLVGAISGPSGGFPPVAREDLSPRGPMARLADFALGSEGRRERTEVLLGQDAVSLTEQRNAESSLYGAQGEPDPMSVRQGREGSCWLMAVVSQLAPEEIQELIERTPEGETRVHFPGREPELVSELTEAERLVYSQANGDWAALLEKAAAQVFARESQDINGDNPVRATELLRGSTSDMIFLDVIPDPGQPDYRDLNELHQRLEENTQDDRIITASAFDFDFDPAVSNISSPGHTYAVLDYDPETRFVTVRNPWGQGERADRDGHDDGVFQMSLEDFHLSFTGLAIENPCPTP